MVFFVDPLWGAVAIVACLAVIALTRFISLGSMTMLFCYMVLMCIAHWGQWAVCLFTVVCSPCAYGGTAAISSACSAALKTASVRKQNDG